MGQAKGKASRFFVQGLEPIRRYRATPGFCSHVGPWDRPSGANDLSDSSFGMSAVIASSHLCVLFAPDGAPTHTDFRIIPDLPVEVLYSS